MVVLRWLALFSPVFVVLGIALGYAASRVHPRLRFPLALGAFICLTLAVLPFILKAFFGF